MKRRIKRRERMEDKESIVKNAGNDYPEEKKDKKGMKED